MIGQDKKTFEEIKKYVANKIFLTPEKGRFLIVLIERQELELEHAEREAKRALFR